MRRKWAYEVCVYTLLCHSVTLQAPYKDLMLNEIYPISFAIYADQCQTDFPWIKNSVGSKTCEQLLKIKGKNKCKNTI